MKLTQKLIDHAMATAGADIPGKGEHCKSAWASDVFPGLDRSHNVEVAIFFDRAIDGLTVRRIAFDDGWKTSRKKAEAIIAAGINSK